MPGPPVTGQRQGAAVWLGAELRRLRSEFAAPEEKLVAVAASVPPADLVDEGARAAQELVPASSNMAAASVGYADWYGLDLSSALMPPYDTQLPAAMSHGDRPNSQKPSRRPAAT